MNRNSRPVYVGVLAFALIVTCLAGIANAQSATRVTPCSATTANNELCLVITPSSTNVDGTPLTRPSTFRIEQKAGSGAYVQIASALSTPQFLVKGLVPGDYLFRVYQSCVSVPNVITCNESGATTSTTKNIATPVEQPNAPVIIIAATIRANAPPVYRIIQAVTLKPNEVVFAAPAAMRTVFASR
jgi:hypothetical protein